MMKTPLILATLALLALSGNLRAEERVKTLPVQKDLFAFQSIRPQFNLESGGLYSPDATERAHLNRWHGALTMTSAFLSIPEDMLNEGKLTRILAKVCGILPFASLGFSTQQLSDEAGDGDKDNSSRIAISALIGTAASVANELGLKDAAEEAKFIQEGGKKLSLLQLRLSALVDTVKKLKEAESFESQQSYQDAVSNSSALQVDIMRGLRELLESLPSSYVSSKSQLAHVKEYLDEAETLYLLERTSIRFLEGN